MTRSQRQRRPRCDGCALTGHPERGIRRQSEEHPRAAKGTGVHNPRQSDHRLRPAGGAQKSPHDTCKPASYDPGQAGYRFCVGSPCDVGSRPGEVPATGRELAHRFIRLRCAAPTAFAGSHQALLASTGAGIRSSNVVLGQLTKPAFGSDASPKLAKQEDDRLERGQLSHFLTPDVLLPPCNDAEKAPAVTCAATSGTAATKRDVMSQLSTIRLRCAESVAALAESRPVLAIRAKLWDRVRAGAVETASLIRAWTAHVFPCVPTYTPHPIQWILQVC